MKKKITKRDKVLAYKKKHPDASVNAIAKAVGVSYSYVWKIVGNKDTAVLTVNSGTSVDVTLVITDVQGNNSGVFTKTIS